MKSKFRSIFPPISPTIRVALTLACSGTAYAVDLAWDPDPAPGIQQGDGNWDTTSSFWTQDGGTTNEVWVDTTTNRATFSGPAGSSVVSLPGGRTSGGLKFDGSGYTLQSTNASIRTLNMGGDITLAAGTSNTIGNGMLVTRGNNMTIGNTVNTSSGTLTIATGSTVQTTTSTTADTRIDGIGTVVNVSGILQGNRNLNLGLGGTAGITDVTVNILSGGVVRTVLGHTQMGFAGNGIADPANIKATIVVQSGGSLEAGPAADQQIRVGQFGTGILTVQAGGSVSASQIALGNGGSAVGTLNFDGGIIITGFINNGKSGSKGYFNGGTIIANAVNASGLLTKSTGSGEFYVRNGGLTVNSNANDVSIQVALFHSDIGPDNAIDGGLTKTGDGKLTLTAANTYTGPTTVSAGVLELNNSDAIPDTGRLAISNSGSVELTQSETVNSLFFGIVSMPSGTYGASGSGATFEDERFAGGGILTVNSQESSNTLVWDTSADPGYQAGSSGDWNLSATNWSSSGTTLEPWNETLAASFVGSSAGTNVTVTEDIGALSLNFLTSNYHLAGDASPRTLTLGNGNIRPSAATSTTLGNNLNVTTAGNQNIGMGNGNESGTLDILAGAAVETSDGDFNLNGINTSVNLAGVLRVTGASGTSNGTGRFNLGTNQTSGTDAYLTVQSGGQVLIHSVSGESTPGGSNVMQVGFAASNTTDPALVKGTVTVQSGGLIQVGSNGERTLRLGQYGTGTLEIQSGGLVQAGLVALGNGGNAVGILNLNGGTLETGTVNFAKDNSVANFDGGTLKVTGTTGGTLLQAGPGTANVLDGGLTVNTNSLDSTASEDLVGV